jgi:hypothetical protein
MQFLSRFGDDRLRRRQLAARFEDFTRLTFNATA